VSAALAWPGHGPIQEVPESGGPSLLASHTLLEPARGSWIVVGHRVRDARGTYGALGGGAASSRVAPADLPLLPVPGPLEPLPAALLPAAVQVSRAIEAAPDLGWVAVVAGDGLRAEMLLDLLPRSGARRTVRVPTGEADAAGAPADETVPGGALHPEELASRLRSVPGPVVAFETGGDPAAQRALLAALPRDSHLVLLESGAPGAGISVDFYRDVHRKNAVLHGIARTDPGDAVRSDRAIRLLCARLSAGWRPRVTGITARAGITPGATGGLLLLAWPEC
jgi:threonine dehydrogenase-like Zn-dependent dehydrogenase